jgi:iron complex outermembrane receptor protein
VGFRILGAAALLAAVFAQRAQAQQPEPPQPNLPTMSLEDLMQVKIEPVFGASKRLQPVTEAPASVTIVTAEDIERYGYRTLGDILRGVRGFYVTNDRNYTYLGARGFAIPGDYNTRILMLVDGHRMNDNVYEQATVGAEFGLDPSTFARVEIIRGPASSLYGTSAFFAVVNIVTKAGAAVNGVQAAADTGSFGERSLRVAGGRTFKRGVDVLFSGSYTKTNGPTLYFPEFDTAATNYGVVRGLDGEKVSQFFGRLSAGHWTMSGAFGSRDKRVPTAAFETVFGDPRFRTTDAHGYFDAQYDRMFGRARLNVRGYADRYHYDGDYPEAGWEGTPPVVLYNDYANGGWAGAEARVTTPVGPRQTMILGAEFRDNYRQDQGVDYVDDVVPDFLIHGTSQVVASYVQDEIRLLPRLIVNAGLRYDGYSGFSRLAPRVAVIVNTSQNQAFKYLYGNAFRAPNAYELDYSVFGVRHANLRPETINTHEVVWERYVGKSLRTSASAYVNHVAALISPDPMSDPANLLYINQGHVNAAGMELEGEVRLSSGVRGQMSYVLQRAKDADSSESLSNSPRHAVKAQISVTGPSRMVTSGEVQYMSARLTLSGQQVDAVTLTNLTVRSPLGHGWVLASTLRNLFDQTYADPGSAEHPEDAIRQDGRTFRIGLEWHIGVK